MTLRYERDLKILKMCLYTTSERSRPTFSNVRALQADTQTHVTESITMIHHHHILFSITT